MSLIIFDRENKKVAFLIRHIVEVFADEEICVYKTKEYTDSFSMKMFYFQLKCVD